MIVICLRTADVTNSESEFLIICGATDSHLGYFCAHMSCHYSVINVNDINDKKLFFEKNWM